MEVVEQPHIQKHVWITVSELDGCHGCSGNGIDQQTRRCDGVTVVTTVEAFKAVGNASGV